MGAQKKKKLSMEVNKVHKGENKGNQEEDQIYTRLDKSGKKGRWWQEAGSYIHDLN